MRTVLKVAAIAAAGLAGGVAQANAEDGRLVESPLSCANAAGPALLPLVPEPVSSHPQSLADIIQEYTADYIRQADRKEPVREEVAASS